MTTQYQRPATLGEAAQLARGEARLLAGGQSLLGAMRLGLSRPSALIDLAGIPGLSGIRVEAGKVTIGAMATHAAVAAAAEVRKAIPALAALAEGIGDRQVRNVGTLGGSLANNDPAACYPAAVLGLAATIQTDRRTIAADDFFKGLYETALAEGEIITSVVFPVPERAAYEKFCQPASRFSIVGVFVAKAAGGVRVAVTGASSCVHRCKALEDALNRRYAPESCDGVAISSAGVNADQHGSAEYRAALVPVLTRRAVAASLA